MAAEVLTALSQARIALTNFSLGTPSLDDVFFALTGRAAEDEPKDDAQEETTS
jgi:ABC-2 type transport system ATP-binding protein